MSAEARTSRGGLFGRIFLSFAVGILLFVAITAGGVFVLVRATGPAWVSDVVEAVDARNDAVATLFEHISPPPQPERIREISESLSEQLDAEVRIVPSMELRGRRGRGRRGPASRLNPKQLKKLERGIPVVIDRGRRPSIVVWRIISPTDGRLLAFVFVERSGQPSYTLALGLVALIASIFAVSWPLARSLTRRLHQLTDSTRQFAKGELNHRAVVGGDDEVDELARAFNEMAERISSLITGQRSLLANVSHELRTPMARMRVLLELLEGKAARLAERGDPSAERLVRGIDELTTDVAEMETLVRDLLTSGRLELGKALERAPLDLDALCRTLAERFHISTERRGEDPEPPTGDALLIERLLSNLLANAQRACPDGRVELRIEADDLGWTLIVEDEGPGVPPERREEIFEAFTRLDAARSRDRGGVGLGLYLARQIARGHGGDLVVGDRKDGASGARFEFRLPRAPAATG